MHVNEKVLFQMKRIYFKRKGFISQLKRISTLNEKNLSEKKSEQKKRKENYFFQTPKIPNTNTAVAPSYQTVIK